MRNREQQEAEEAERLAPYAFPARLTGGRAHPEPEHPYRGIYQRDRDRIVHCTAFRRLEYKTQVFVNHEGDYYRTRLTHTLEVAQVARTIARVMRLNEDLTEAVALAHDLGHPPFGHAGEDEMNALMAGHGGYEHNRQSLRVVETLEHRYPGFRGLNLTAEVRGALLKHGVSRDGGEALQPLLETQVVDLADSIAYDNHDIDDGIKAGLITPDEMEAEGLWRWAVAEVRREHGALPQGMEVLLAVRALIDREVTDLVEHSQEAIGAARVASPGEARRQPRRLVGFSPALQDEKRSLQGFLFRSVYRHHRVMRMTQKCRRILRGLFQAYREEPRQMPPEFQEWARAEGLEQAVCDYLAGMTDRYAQDQYRVLFLPHERV